MTKKRLWGLSLLLSILALLIEAVVAYVVAVVHGFTQEPPSLGGGSVMFVFFLPVVAVFGTAVAGVVSVVLVLPTVRLSAVLGRRFGGREAWGWVPAVAAAVSLVLVVALSGGSGPVGIAVAWPLTTAALTVPALLWRSRRERIFGPVLLWGLVSVVLTAVLGGAGLATGIIPEYRPPAVTSAELVGRWSDGLGGTLTFTADGRVSAVDVGAEDDDDGGDDSDSEPDACTGQGTWSYEAGEDTRSQVLTIDVPPCTFGYWNIGGRDGRPTLYQYVGDPDSGDLYELTKTSGGP
ncbi:hypothetical protein DTB58_16175 [Streptomyces griseus]|uniref:hypothetical protein n=1 Tax=Streptomyces griseus TaxID=1911 RepID=UPI001C5925D6|nr:hypothetical protein [Streptomyces griseus]MBW3705597.1 hypothetical protein [Streptomyces griseus]